MNPVSRRERVPAPLPRWSAGVRTVAILLLAWSAGCRSAEPGSSPPPADPVVAADSKKPPTDYDFTEIQFELAEYWKPSESGAAIEDVQLAPLLVLETSMDQAPAARPLNCGGGGVAADDVVCMYFDDGAARLHDRDYRQRSYMWQIEDAGKRVWIGYRLTMGEDGLPFVWEWFDERRDVALIFVSRRLEDAAAEAFGPPLPGRRYSVETAADVHGDVIVPRVLDKSPEPLGPFVYMDRRNRMTTLICRCMPSQVKQFSDTVYYRLRPALGSWGLGDDDAPPAAGTSLPPHLRGVAAEPDCLAKRLRLPESWQGR